VRYRARAPLRIDFGGGWTDVPFYAESEGGAVLNAAITRYVHGFIARPETEGLLHTLRGDRCYVSYTLDAPVGAGLGASAAQTVLWVSLVKTSIANLSDRLEIAEIACGIAALLGIVGGKQDEYASALGGIGYYTFDAAVHPQRLDLPSATVRELRSRLVLVYSGKQRLSGSIHESVWSRYRQGAPATVGALATLKRLAIEMKDALLTANIDALGPLLSENWAAQRALDPSVTNPLLDDIFDFAIKNGALGGKACGAGGGGCLVFLSAPDQASRLQAAFKSRKLPVIDFDFDHHGVYLTSV
jgi:D-glycero-alpha-D-manno-heptose-7-phosphate kinase